MSKKTKKKNAPKAEGQIEDAALPMNGPKTEFFEKYELKWILPLIAVCFLVFANTLGGEFVYDDSRQILRNQLIQDNSLIWKALTSDVWAFKGDGSMAASNYWRPTFTLWHIINFRLFGANPFGWHLLNILLHAGICVLAFKLLRRWGISAMIACAIVIVFAVHPVHTESVAWISGSPDLLFGAAFLGSLWFAQDYAEDSKAKNLIISLLLYGIALGAKEIGILCLPIYYFVLLPKDEGKKPDFMILGAYLAIAAIYFIARLGVLGAVSRPPEDAVGFGTAILSVPSIFFFYIRQVFFPFWISANYPLQPTMEAGFANFILPAIISLVFLGGLFLLAKRSKTGIIAALLFLLPLIPAMNAMAFIPDQIAHDRYLYLPLLGILMLIFSLAAEFLDGKILLIGGGILAAILSIQTIPYNRAWANEFDLWAWSARIDNSAFTQAQYAAQLSEKGRIDEAIQTYSASIETRPMLRSYYGRGRNYNAKRQFAEAEKDFRMVLSAPIEKQEAYLLYQTHESLAILYLEQKRFDEAIASLNKARKELPIYSASLTAKLAVVLYQKGDKESALKELESAKSQARKELLPESKSVFLRLGMLYSEQGKKDEARAALQEYMKLTETIKDANTQKERAQAASILKGP